MVLNDFTYAETKDNITLIKDDVVDVRSARGTPLLSSQLFSSLVLSEREVWADLEWPSHLRRCSRGLGRATGRTRVSCSSSSLVWATYRHLTYQAKSVFRQAVRSDSHHTTHARERELILDWQGDLAAL